MRHPAPPLVVALVLLAVAGVATPGAMAAPPRPVESPRAEGGGAPTLSPRLEALSTPAVQALDETARAQALSVGSEGFGSLMEGPDGIAVTIRVAGDREAAVVALERAGANIVSVTPSVRTVTARVPAPALSAVAAVPGVEYVKEVLRPDVEGADAAGLAAALGQASIGAGCPTGVLSEGDDQLRAGAARSAFGVDGSGVKVGILSDSFDNRGGAAADVVAGELPGAANPCGHPAEVQVEAEWCGPCQDPPQSEGTDEGRAMAQIVHDLAPGASLSFATAFNSDADFANQIVALRAGGASVIVDDVTYPNDPMFQDGVIGQAINEVTATGAVYFSSAGNQNVVIGGKDVGSYEAPTFRPMDCPVGIPGTIDACHDFDPGGGNDPGDDLAVGSGGRLRLYFGWNEPQFGVATDLDLFLVDTATNEVVAEGRDPNAVSGEAFEYLDYRNLTSATQNLAVVIGRSSASPTAGTPRIKVVLYRPASLWSVEWNTSSGGDVVGPTLFGHHANLAGAAVGATPYHSSTSVESYSSRGPALVCWEPVTSTTPASPLPACSPKQIDVTATDGVATSFFNQYASGTWRFYGTSAAAPHAAAVAALQRQLRPADTPCELISTQRLTAEPLPAFGVGGAGNGRVDATAALAAPQPCGGRFHPVVPFRAVDSRRGAGVEGAIDAGTSTRLTVAPSGGPDGLVPADATAVVVNLTVTGGTAASYLTAFPAGAPLPPTANLNFVAGQTTSNLAVVKVGEAGQVELFNAAGSVHVVADVVGYVDDGGEPGDLFNGIAPARLVDSRQAGGSWGGSPLRQDEHRDLVVSGGPIPASATGVVMNVTATEGTAASYVQVYPAGSPQPITANVLFGPGQTVSTLVVSKIGTGGQVRFYNQLGDVHVIVDVVGYYSADDGGARFYPINPARALDSRDGTGGYHTTWGPGVERSVPIAGTNGIPDTAHGVSGLVMNTTVTQGTQASFLTVFPDLVTNPGTANVLFGPGETVPNSTMGQLGGNGNVRVFNQLGSVHVIGDVAGFYGG